MWFTKDNHLRSCIRYANALPAVIIFIVNHSQHIFIRMRLVLIEMGVGSLRVDSENHTTGNADWPPLPVWLPLTSLLLPITRGWAVRSRRCTRTASSLLLGVKKHINVQPINFTAKPVHHNNMLEETANPIGQLMLNPVIDHMPIAERRGVEAWRTQFRSAEFLWFKCIFQQTVWLCLQ